MPDVGSTLAALETASGRKAKRVGKPEVFGLYVMLEDHFESEREEWAKPEYLAKFCYVGDNIETDVYFCKNAGIGSVLVLSGLAKGTETDKIKKTNPTYIMAKFCN